MIFSILWGILFPFLGTLAGSTLVFALRWDQEKLRRNFSGAAAGIMVAASIFGLLLPALEISAAAAVGFFLGIGFLLIPDWLLPRWGKRRLKRSFMIVLALVLHNIPEGMAVGVSFGSWLSGSGVCASDALAVGLGIGLQNLPDGALVALPLAQEGMKPAKAFARGVLSGLVEPVAAGFMLVWAGHMTPALPALMSFAAGTMLYVVARELIPAMELGRGKKSGGLCFLAALALMAAVNLM